MFLQVDEHFVYFSIHIAISFKFADQESVEVLCHRRSNAPSVLRMLENGCNKAQNEFLKMLWVTVVMFNKEGYVPTCLQDIIGFGEKQWIKK